MIPYLVEAQPSYFVLDPVTCRDLEIFQVENNLDSFATSGGGSKCQEGSLFWLLNRCKSPSGKRCLKEWLLRPLVDITEIHRRQEAVLWFLSSGDHAGWEGAWIGKLKGVIAEFVDAEKLLASLHHRRISARRLVKLLRLLERLSELRLDPATTSLVPAYITDSLSSCCNNELLYESKEFLGCLNLSAIEADDLPQTFNHEYELRHKELTELKTELAAAEVLYI